MLIKGLRQEWDEQDVRELRHLLSLLTPPFESVEDFQVRVETDIGMEYSGVTASPLLAAAAVEARFAINAAGNVTGTLVHRLGASAKRIQTTVAIPFDQLIHPNQRPKLQRSLIERFRTLGPASAILLFYPQREETLQGLDLQLSDLREFLDVNAGVRVYRDNIRVPPYGDVGRPEGDWLALGDRKARNPAGPNRKGFRVSPYQLVGAVFISRDTNPNLVDTSGREGLVAGEALTLLKSFLIGCIIQLEAQYHKAFTERSARISGSTPQASPRETVDELRARLSDLAETINESERTFPSGISGKMGEVVRQLASAKETLKRAEKSFEELGSQAAISRTLATIGIATATFGHETQRGLDSMKAALEAAKLFLLNGDDPRDVLSELEKALHESAEVSAWGAFALGRVRRDKRIRRIVDVAAIVTNVLNEICPAMESSSISLSRELKSTKAKVFAIDLECVLINLLTNSYYFSKMSSRDRRVEVRLATKVHAGRKGFELVVADSGPGVAPANRDKIWNPLFTTKIDDRGREVGTGLGLFLVSTVVQDTEGERSIDDDPVLGGARFSIWMPDGGM